jgi:hypothetical protein
MARRGKFSGPMPKTPRKKEHLGAVLQRWCFGIQIDLRQANVW